MSQYNADQSLRQWGVRAMIPHLKKMKPGQRRRLEPGSAEALAEKLKASVRAKVEPPFLYMKRALAMPRCAAGGWPRTGSDWRCCWDWPTG